jgi:hypothetical protein
MRRGRTFLGIALVAALALPLSACAGKVRLSGKSMCDAAGGTYNMQTHTCAPGTAGVRQASQMCAAHGGTWMADLGVCETEGSK